MDHKLDELLAQYKVKDADQALTDRIVARAAASKPQRHAVWRQCAMFAVVAGLGFWLGNLQGQKAAAVHGAAVTATAAATSADQTTTAPVQEIIGADSLNDLML